VLYFDKYLKEVTMSLQKRINYVSRVFYVSSIALLFTILTPFFAVADQAPFQQAELVAQMSQSNPYQALVYILSVITGLSIVAMCYLYHQQQNNLKEQFTILKNVSDNINTLSNKIENSQVMLEKNQEIIAKSIDVVDKKLGEKPCLLNSDLMKDLIKR